MTQITFFVPGEPRPGGSKKGFVIWDKRKGKHRAILTEDCARSKDWRAVVALKAAETFSAPFDGAVLVTVEFHMPRPKYHFGKRGLRPSAPAHHVTRPDLTKCWRSTEDALKGIAWRDDSQVVDQHVRKVYGETPGAWITIEAAGQQPVEARTMAPQQSGLFAGPDGPSCVRNKTIC